MTLQQDIDNFNQEVLPDFPEDILTMLMGKIKALKESDIENSALKKGDKIPEFTLQNAIGYDVFSEDLLEKVNWLSVFTGAPGVHIATWNFMRCRMFMQISYLKERNLSQFRRIYPTALYLQ